MRRKKDNKRVLRRGNGNENKRSRRAPHVGINRNNNHNRHNKVKKEKKRSGKTVLIMILVLVAFIVGAGVGILLSFDDGSVDNNESYVENVTVEMTTNVNKSNDVIFDESDAVDFNENESSAILDADKNPYYNKKDPDY